MRKLVRAQLMLVLATSMSAFAASKASDASEATNVNTTEAEAMAALCPVDPEISQAQYCSSCQTQSEDRTEQQDRALLNQLRKRESDRQQLIQQENREWLKQLPYLGS